MTFGNKTCCNDKPKLSMLKCLGMQIQQAQQTR